MSNTPRRNYPHPDPEQPYALTSDLANLANAIDEDMADVAGGGAGTMSLDELLDVDLASSPAMDGQTLLFDSAAGVFKAADFQANGATALNGLTDVDTFTVAPAEGNVLVRRGDKFVPEAPQVGATALDGLTDVDLTTKAPAEGDVLVRRGTQFTPEAPQAGVTALDGLTDVDLATKAPTEGDVLVRRGTQFVPEAPSSGGATTLDGLTDVDTTGALTGQVLALASDGSWKPVDQASGGGGSTNGGSVAGAALALRTTAQTAASGWRTIPFDTVVHADPDFATDPAAGTITVPETGWYSIYGVVGIASATSGNHAIAVEDATGNIVVWGNQLATVTIDYSVSGVARIQAGSVLRLRYYTSSTTTVDSNRRVWFNVARLGGSSSSSSSATTEKAITDFWANSAHPSYTAIDPANTLNPWTVRLKTSSAGRITAVRGVSNVTAGDTIRFSLVRLAADALTVEEVLQTVDVAGVAGTQTTTVATGLDWPLEAGKSYAVGMQNLQRKITMYYSPTTPNNTTDLGVFDKGFEASPNTVGTVKKYSGYPVAIGIDGATVNGATVLSETVVALGTSIADGAGATSASAAYPARTAVHTGDALGKTVTVVEEGVSGDTTAQMLARLPALLQKHQPAYVTIEASVNDSNSNNAVALSETAANLREMVALCRLARTTPVIMTAAWFDPTLGSGWDQVALDEVQARNADARALGAELGVSVVDLWDALPHDNTVLADKLHPNDTGHDAYAQELSAALVQTKWAPAHPVQKPKDTGLRDVRSLLTANAGWNDPGVMSIRRSGTTVALVVQSLGRAEAGTGNVTFMTLPVGFRPDMNAYSQTFRGYRLGVLTDGTSYISSPGISVDYLYVTFLTNDPDPVEPYPGTPA